jgi:hypothetical protein
MNGLAPTALAGLLLIVLGANGCGRKNPVPPRPDTPQSLATIAAEPAGIPSAAPPPSSPPPPPQANADQTLQWLNKVVHDYVMWKKVVPRDLNEVVASGMLSSVPAAPPGKRYIVILHPLGYRVEMVDE